MACRCNRQRSRPIPRDDLSLKERKCADCGHHARQEETTLNISKNIKKWARMQPAFRDMCGGLKFIDVIRFLSFVLDSELEFGFEMRLCSLL